MGVDSKHPLFSEHEEEWSQMRDTYKGERIVKEAGFKYLPATSGMIADGAGTDSNSDGWKAYSAYRLRSRYPGLVKEAVAAMLGVMHNKPPTIELPAALEPLRLNATLRNESLDMLLMRINLEQLIMGRTGLLADVIDAGDLSGQFYISLYQGEHIINWDEGQRSRDLTESSDDRNISVDEETVEPQNLNFVSLNESGFERIQQFEWKQVNKYRVLILGDTLENEPLGEGVYRVGVFRDNQFSFNEEQMEEVSVNGNTTDEIPFVFINTKDIVPEPDEPPLLGLSNLTLTIYRGEADYRQALFMQGQDTLVVIGSPEDKQYRVGANTSINIPNTAGDAKYVGVDSNGLPEMRSSLENDYRRGETKAGQMLQETSRMAESGEALKVRVSARTSTLNQVAMTGAYGLEQLLKKMARWIGADPEEVVVRPNLDFVDDELSGRTLVEYMTAKSLGATFSLESIHQLMQDRGLTEKTFDEEIAAIESEAALDINIGSTNPDGPEEGEPNNNDNDPDSINDMNGDSNG